MANIFSKARSLLHGKKYSELFQKATNYIRYTALRVWFTLTFKEQDSDLKKTNKNYVMYVYFKEKYKKFIKNYPVTYAEKHEYSNIIWWCWLQGEENAPKLCQACLASLKRVMPDREIKIITNKNIYNYVDFPDFIKEKYRKGIISNAHFSDLLRLELLIKYGGMWIDATVFCTGRPDYALNTPLFMFKTNERNDPGITAQNWFISAEKDNSILKLTQTLLYDYWAKYNSAIHYFIFYFFLKIASEKYSKEWNEIPWFPDLPPHIMQRELNKAYNKARWEQLCRMSDLHKLSYKIEVTKNEDTFYKHLLNL